jgi:hypothetical protein
MITIYACASCGHSDIYHAIAFTDGRVACTMTGCPCRCFVPRNLLTTKPVTRATVVDWLTVKLNEANSACDPAEEVIHALLREFEKDFPKEGS